MSTQNEKSPEQILEYINVESNKFLQGVMRSEDTGGSIQNLTSLWTQLITQCYSDPKAWMNIINEHQQIQLKMWADLMGTTLNFGNQNDVRFSSEEWTKSPIFVFIKQSYLLVADIIGKMSNALPDEVNGNKRLKFFTQYFVDAMSPSNFAALNPDVIKEAVETNGKSILDGFQNLMDDLKKGRITMTDEKAFALGENLALSEGSVIYRNHLIELIQYKPTTSEVAKRPLLIVPPCINKYYILDLQPHNSFVKWCIEQGNTVFMISWNNPTSASRNICWDDYITSGILEATRVIKEVTTEKKINTVGWCVGGTILSTAMGVMQKKRDSSIASATLLTTLLDYSDPGQIGVFLEKENVNLKAGQIENEGLMSGKNLAFGFSMLRSNDLIWTYVINNYLKGKTPPPFDILYWNSDSTNLSAKMYNKYVKEMYLENKLALGRFICCSKKIDLSKIKVPIYFLSTIDDHIAPWKTTFAGTKLMGGSIEFVLGESGHIAGVINPPAKNKRSFWIDGEMGKDADHWLKTASKYPGSWWINWHLWLNRQNSEKVAARDVGCGDYKEIVAAPGDFARVRV